MRIDSISRPSPLPGHQGVRLKFQSSNLLCSWLLLATSHHPGKGSKSNLINITKDIIIAFHHLETSKRFGSWVSEMERKTKYIFLIMNHNTTNVKFSRLSFFRSYSPAVTFYPLHSKSFCIWRLLVIAEFSCVYWGSSQTNVRGTISINVYWFNYYFYSCFRLLFKVSISHTFISLFLPFLSFYLL